jgi:hypothetical protein
LELFRAEDGLVVNQVAFLVVEVDLLFGKTRRSEGGHVFMDREEAEENLALDCLFFTLD